MRRSASRLLERKMTSIDQGALLKMFQRFDHCVGRLFITGLSLFVGGIGIMNIMFVS